MTPILRTERCVITRDGILRTMSDNIPNPPDPSQVPARTPPQAVPPRPDEDSEHVITDWTDDYEELENADDDPRDESQPEPLPADAETPTPKPIAAFEQKNLDSLPPEEPILQGLRRGVTPPAGFRFEGDLKPINPEADNLQLQEPENPTPQTLFDQIASEPDTPSPASTDEPFFPMLPNPPEVEKEDTAELTRRALRKKRRSPVARFFSALFWLVVLTFGACVVLALVYFRYASDRIYNTQFNQNREVIVSVNPGDRLSKVVANMQQQGLLGTYLGIPDAWLLRYIGYANENANRIKTGTYRLNTSMSLNDIYTRLQKGSDDFRVTIPEGKVIGEVAEIVRKRLENFDERKFVELCRDKAFIQSLGMNLPSLEGYLYPSTYSFSPDATEEDVIRKMVKTFQEIVTEELKTITKTDNLSFHDHIIMASLIEREARTDSDRPLIASVIINRIAKNMRLEIDATIHFALDDWSRRLTYNDLKIDSPYNTYRNTGLPPGPICSPRIASILATYTAPKTTYLFYVHKGDGSHAFADTFEEHKANIRLYRKSAAEPTPTAFDDQTTKTETKSPSTETNAP